MFFKRLEIHGFKSFAEPVTIEFDRGITCVVGPNGSGKSNICDALRWVLGEQSSKMLRGDKMEDVIFAGTASRKSRGMAEVTLIIDNSDGAMPIDYNEVAITRRMYRSGESEYLINNNRCRMKDIRELIMDTGIGVEGYSIIGQGKISDIISNNTDSIREILEETAGIVMYRSRKAEAERKLSAANSNMERVNDIVGEIEGRIGMLKSDSEKAREYIGLKDRHKELEINITLKNIENIDQRNEVVKNDITELQSQIDAGRGRREELGAVISAESARREALDAEIDEMQQRQITVTDEINTLVGESRLREEKMASVSRDIERLQAEISELAKKISKEKDNSRELFATKDTADAKLKAMVGALREKTDKYDEMNRRLRELAEAIDDSKNKAIEIQSGINSRNAEISSITSLRDNLEARKASVVSEKTSGENENAAAEEALEKAKSVKNDLKSKLNAANAGKSSLADTYTEHYNREKQLGEELGALNLEIGRLSSRKKTIEEMEANYEGYNHGVRFVMRSDIRGIFGTVAELVDVPQGFETAVETALGATLQNIICDSDETAKKAITKLKENNAGRITFLPVGSVVGREAVIDEAIKSEPGFRGFGVDCVKFDPQYKEIMKYLLGKVAIVDNMDSAIVLSKKYRNGLRFVTLEGEVINAGGAITGGRFRNRTANLLERKAEIAQLKNRLDDANAEAAEKNTEREEITVSLHRESESIRQKEAEIKQLERDFYTQENAIAVIESSLSDYRNSVGKLQREIDAIDDQQGRSDETAAMLRDEVEKNAALLEELEQNIGIMSDKYDADRKAADVFDTEITEDRIALGAFESEKNSIDVVVDKTNETIGGYENDKKVREAELQARTDEQKELNSHYEGSAGETDVKKAEKEELDAGLTALRAEKAALVRKLEAETAEKKELDEKASETQDQKYQLEIQKTKHETQLENAKAKLWDEFEVSYLQAIDMKKEDFIMSSAVRENREIKNRMKELGDVNIGAIEEYRTVSERYEFLTAQRADIIASTEELKKIIADMDKIIRSKFKESFDSVTVNFEEVFRDLYGGGHAKISLENENDPFDSEIEITAQPPGKQLKHINLLSGGEKTMTAIALMFAVLKTKPTPFCILDEIEAALDDQNLEIFGDYVQKFSGVQFTLITHQKSTMEHADTMYGITMPESGVSKVYSLKLGEEPAM
jgi:chromosome segregation protein SMC, common bacterial type